MYPSLRRWRVDSAEPRLELTDRQAQGPHPRIYPVGLVLENRACLVVGGGRIAARKAESLLACGADVTVVAPQVSEAMLALADARTEGNGSLKIERRAYVDGEAAFFRLVIAATGDRQVNARVFEDGEKAGVWVNSADDPALCSFLLPAVYRSGTVSVSVSTGGSSPGLAAWVRDKAAEMLEEDGQNIGDMAALFGRVRDDLHREGRSSEGINWAALASNEEIAELIRRQNTDRALEMIREEVAKGGARAENALGSFCKEVHP